jgi:PmbA protein
VSEVTIAGNVMEMLLHMTPADDLVFRRGTDSPTVRVDGLTMAGG